MSLTEGEFLEKRHYLPSLTGLRCVAAFSILLGHLAGDFSFHLFGHTYPLGWLNLLGMPLFFVLSGFVVHYNYALSFSKATVEKEFWQASRSFLFARFSRIYPLFFCMLIFVMFNTRDNLFANWYAQGEALSLSLAYLTGVFSWWPIYSNDRLIVQGPYGIAWSISTEFFFYFVYIFIARHIFGLRTMRLALGFFAICVIAGYAVQIPGPWQGTEDFLHHIFGPGHVRLDQRVDHGAFYNSYYRWLFYVSPYSRIFEFFLGCAAAQLFVVGSHRMHSRWITGPGLWTTLAGIAIVFGIMGAYLNQYTDSPTKGPYLDRYFVHLHLNFLYAPLMALLILIGALRDLHMPAGKNFLAAASLVFLGEISLSVYLIHPTMMEIVGVDVHSYLLPLQIVFALVLVSAVSVGTYTMIEVPARRVLRKLFGVRSSVHSPVVVKAVG